MNKLAQILTGEHDFPSDEILVEIKTVSGNYTAAEETLVSLDADLEAKRLLNLGKAPTKDIKRMEAEKSDLMADMDTMVTALEKLKNAHTEAINLEIPAELIELRTKISDLQNQKIALMPEVLRVCGEAAALFFQVRGRFNFEMGPNLGPNFLLSREESALYFETWQGALEGKMILPNEIDRLSTRRMDLLVEGRRRGLSVR